MTSLDWMLIGLAATTVFAFAAFLHYRFWVRRLSFDLEYASEERITTADGVDVVLRRLPRFGRDGLSEALTDEPEVNRESEGSPPVLLVHGLALNHRNNDLSENLSLARHLARGGRDVWLLTLRSGRADLSSRDARRVSFDAMARFDVPAAVTAVLERTRATELDYVGFSMGGMLLYAAYGDTLSAAQLRRVVVVGSPAVMTPPPMPLGLVARCVPAKLVPPLPLRLPSRAFSTFADIAHTPIHRWIYNPENVDRGVAAHALVNGFVNIPSGLARELRAWTNEGDVVRRNGVAITDGLEHARTPALFIAGQADRLATPASVRYAFRAWGAEVESIQKDFRTIGLQHAAAADYGHGDLAIGRFADQDVFDPIAEWLDVQ